MAYVPGGMAALAKEQAKEGGTGVHSTVNITAIKGFHLRELITSVTAGTWKRTLQQIFAYCANRGTAGDDEIGPNDALTLPSSLIPRSAMQAAAAQVHSGFHALRYSIAQCTASVVAGEKGNNFEERVKLLAGLIGAACDCDNVVSTLADMFCFVPITTDVTFESVSTLLEKQLRLPATQQWAVAIGLMYSSREAYITIGRKLIEAKCATEMSALNTNLEIALRTLVSTDALLCTSSAKDAIKKLHSSISDAPHDMPGAFASLSVADTAAALLGSISIGGLIEDMGPACVSTHADCAALLATFTTITPKLVAEGMAVLARPSLFASSRDTNAYNSFRASMQKSNLASVPSSAGVGANPERVTEFLFNFVGAVKEKVPRIDWHAVLAALDSPGIIVENFAAIAKGYTRVADGRLPADIFYGKWRNTAVQAKAVLFMMNHPDQVDFPRIATGKGTPKHKALPPTITSTNNPALAPWATVDFFEAVCYVAGRERGVAEAVKKAVTDAPAQLFCGFLLSQPQGSLVHFTFAFQTLRTHGAAACLTEAGVAHLTTESRLGALTGLIGQLVIAEPGAFVEIIEVVIARKLAAAILSAKGVMKLVTGVAIASSGTNDIPTNWLENHVPSLEGARNSEEGNPFEIAAAALEVCDEFLSRQKFTKNAAAALKVLGGAAVKAVLPTISAHATALLESGDSSFPPEVEEAARRRVKDFIQRPSSGRIAPIEEVEQLARSTDAANRQMFSCIVSILLEDVMNLVPISFTTMSNAGQLYGGLIGRKLLEDKRAVPALQFVLTCISKEKDARTNEFGIKALEAFYHRLPEWPHYGKQLKAVEHIYLDMRIPGIMAVIRSAKRSSKAAAAAAASAEGQEEAAPVEDAPEVSEPTSSRLHQHDITVLMSTAKIVAPPSTVCDEINFLVGNTDPENLRVNSASIRELLKPEYLDYFADYIVVKRVSLEPNNHNLYLDVLKEIGNAELDITVRKATARCVRTILANENPDSSQRSLLKALGSWYGQMTIARNMPVPARELHFKEMIFDALRNGKLLFVVPFVAKVLERCSVPNCAFAPKNPWTMCQLMLLLEVYNLPNVDTKLMFELDILLRAINCTMGEVEAFASSCRIPRSSISAMRRIRSEMDHSKPNPDFRFDEHAAAFGGTSPPPGRGGMSRLSSQAAPYQPPVGPPKLPLHPDIVHSKENVVVSGIERYTANRVSQFQEALLALIASILTRKVVLDHIDRSVTVACNTTKSLVMKDFTLDPDIESMRKAGITMVRSLASNHCISFREALGDEARKVFQMLANKLAKNDPQRSNEILEIVHRNNIGLVYRIAESQAARRSEERFLAEFQEVARTKESALRSGQLSLTPDQQEYRRDIQAIPAALRDLTCVTAQQRRVYDDFANCNPTLELVYSQVKNIEDIAIKLLTKKDQSIAVITNETVVSEEVGEAINKLRSDVAKETAEYLAPHVLFRLFIIQDKISATAAVDAGSVAMQVLLVSRIAFLTLLAECKRYATDAPISNAFVNDDRRWKQLELCKRLVYRGLLSHTILDKALIADLQHSHNDVRREAEAFAKDILSFIVSVNIAAESIVDQEFAQTISHLKRGASADHYANGITSIRIQSIFNYPAEMRERINGYIDNWTAINQTPRKERSTEFMKELQDNRMLRSGAEGHIRELLGTMLEASVEDFSTRLLTSPVPLASLLGRSGTVQFADPSLYIKTDASTDFVSLLIKCCSSPKDQPSAANSSTLNLLNRMLSIYTEVLRNNHSKCIEMTANPESARNAPALPAGVAYQVTFNQRPYVRFLSNIMENNLSKKVVPNLNQDNAVRGFLDQLKALSPMNLPGFAFGWLELICHRCLTARCLAGESRQYWDDYAALLVEGLRFVDSFVGAGRTATPSAMLFFKGLFKLMLVILHDFPVFAHAYCHYLCGYIPHSCIQLRNVVLSAFPYPELPDPFQTKFNESNKREENRVRHEISGPVMDSLKGLVDPEVFLKAYREKSVVPGLLSKLKATDGGRSPWNIHAINAITLAISNASLTLSNEEHDVTIENPAVRQFIELCDGLDDEGRYYLLNACANHLRCPNSHTNFFGHLLLFFFKVENQRFTRLGETGAEATREQVTRVLAERLTAVRPHPWGLLVVLLELVDNQQYHFNQRPFINCSPEVASTIKELQASIIRQQVK